jgi:hypothetical protein
MSLKKYLKKFAAKPPANADHEDQRGADGTPAVGSGTSGGFPLDTTDANTTAPAPPQVIPPRPGRESEEEVVEEVPENLTPTIGDGWQWLKPMGIGGAAGAGIQAWRKSRQIDALLDEGYTREEAESIVQTSVGKGAVLGAAIGGGTKYVHDNYDSLKNDLTTNIEDLKNYFNQK